MGLPTDEQHIDEALAVLPAIGRRLYASLMEHPMNSGRSLGQVKALGFLHRAGAATLGELARGLGISLPTASELVDRLVDDGLVIRDIDPDDRRRVRIDLTPLARELGKHFHDMRRAQVRAALESLTDEQRAAFVPALRALAMALEREPHDLPGCPVPPSTLPPPDTPALPS